MNGIIGFTDLLLDDDLSVEHRRYLETIKMSGKSLLALLNDILDISKIEAGKLTLEEIPTNIETLALEANELIRSKITNDQLELLCDIDHFDSYIVGDPTRLRQFLVFVF